jgi:hypothetical protein
MVLSLAGGFTAPTKETFAVLITGWVLCLGWHTIKRIVDSAAERAEKHVSSYCRFFSRARWNPDEPFLDLFAKTLVPLVAKTGTIDLAGDDSTCAKSGRSVAFAGYFRDAVHATLAAAS